MSYLFDSYAKIYDHFMRLFHLDDTSVIEHKLSKGNIIFWMLAEEVEH